MEHATTTDKASLATPGADCGTASSFMLLSRRRAANRPVGFRTALEALSKVTPVPPLIESKSAKIILSLETSRAAAEVDADPASQKKGGPAQFPPA